MIRIYLYKNNENYIGFKSVGHADYSNGEYDIVCSAVSVLTQTLYFFLIYDLKIDEDLIDDEQEDGYLKIILKENIENLRVQDAFIFMVRGLKNLENQYSSYIKIEQMEVQ